MNILTFLGLSSKSWNKNTEKHSLNLLLVVMRASVPFGNSIIWKLKQSYCVRFYIFVSVFASLLLMSFGKFEVPKEKKRQKTAAFL